MTDSRTRRKTTRFQKRAYDALTFNEFSRQLDELGIDELANYFAVTICGQFAIPQVQVFLRDESNLSLAASKGIERREPQALRLSRAAHDILAGDKEARVFEEMRASEALAPLAERFTDWQPSLLFPMVHKSSLVGLCVVGNRIDGKPPGDYQMNLVSAMISHVSLAIGNSRVLEKVRETTRIIKDMDNERKAMHDHREDFVRMACHELNTPLTIINLSLNMLLEDNEAPLTRYQKDLIEQIRENSGRLAEIHKDLIAFAKRNIPGHEYEWTRCNFRDVFDLALEKAGPLFARRPDIRLRTSFADDLPVIDADRERLASAIVNVLQNAIKYTPETGGEITVEALPKDNGVFCSIADTGIGIDPAHIEKVFEPFVELIDTGKRSSSKTRFQGAGMGLGLTIARDIVEKHRGKMWLTSKGKNTGATVFMQIPRSGKPA